MTKGFSAVVHHFGGRVSYRGRRAQPPYDTTEWWEIVDLLLAACKSSIPVFCLSFFCFLVVVVVLLYLRFRDIHESCCAQHQRHARYLRPEDHYRLATMYVSFNSLLCAVSIHSLD
jgi:hypothetical protein